MLNLAKYLLTFSTTDLLEGVHPLQGGILRLKHPSERRPGLPGDSGAVRDATAEVLEGYSLAEAATSEGWDAGLTEG